MMRAEAQIDLAALQHNLTVVKSLAPQKKILAMIKANGYGHGLIRIGNALQTADAFGVACLEEAAALRAAKIQQPIYLMEGFFSQSELLSASANNLTLVLHHNYQIEILLKTSLPHPIDVWLKIDTGMHRLGFPPEKIPFVYQQLINCSWVNNPIGLMTHFAEADNPDSQTTQKQLQLFSSITKNLSGPRSLANSAGIIAWPASHGDWVRPGIMLYGVSPLAKQKSKDLNLRPVMTLKSKLIAINNLHKGDAVGYGGIWSCPEDMPVGVVAIGYGDGYPRHAKNGTPVLIRNERCPLIGRVSMDMITVDLRKCKNATIGDPVILWGHNLPAEEIATWIDTIPYTLFCGVTNRVQFIEVQK